MGCLLEEIEEDGDSSHVDPTTVMVRSCGKEWDISLRTLWRVQTPPMWNHPTSRKGELGRGGGGLFEEILVGGPLMWTPPSTW